MNLHEEALILLGQRLHGGMLLWSLVMVYVTIHGSRFLSSAITVDCGVTLVLSLMGLLELWLGLFEGEYWNSGGWFMSFCPVGSGHWQLGRCRHHGGCRWLGNCAWGCF